MFEQTFVPDVRTGRKRVGIAVSLITQILLLGLVALAPLFLRPPLPSAQLRLLFLGPAPASAPEKPVAQNNTSTHANIVRVRSFRLIAPVAIPKRISASQQGAAEPPDIAGGADGFNPSGASLLSGLGAPSDSIAPPIPRQAPEMKERTSPLAIGGNVAAANLVHRVEPAYPPLAKAARVEGSVVFQAIIGVDGNIRNLQLQEGHPLLVAAARSAIVQWRYRPTLLNGKPVEVVTTITVRFALSQ
jgi:protein TonB